MRIYFVISIVSMLLLSGCGSAKPSPIVNKAEPKQVATKPTETKIIKPKIIINVSIPKSYLPDWIMNSNKDGYLCNIGSARLNGNLAITKKIATIEAKANISQNIQSYIKTQIQLETNCKNQECKEKYSSKINITSTQMIRNVNTVNQYTDTKKGIYYIHLCSKI